MEGKEPSKGFLLERGLYNYLFMVIIISYHPLLPWPSSMLKKASPHPKHGL